MISLTRIALLTVLLCLTVQHTNANRNLFQKVADRLIEELNWNWGDPVLMWNQVACETCACDYDPDMIKQPDQDGPTRTSRALAIVHGIIYDIYNYIYQPWRMNFYVTNITFIEPRLRETTFMIGMTEGAYVSLCSLYPKQKMIYDQVRDAYLKILESIAVADEMKVGLAIGNRIANVVLTERSTDGHNATVNIVIPNDIGYHAADPTRPKQQLHAPHWGNVKPFVLQSGSQFRSPNIVGKTPEDRLKYLRSRRFIRDYIQVVLIGARDSRWRTEEQTEIANFWAYDGAPKLGTPPRFYNKIARTIAIQLGTTMFQNAQMFGLLNYAFVDSCITCWETKYTYNLARPIVVIRRGTPFFPPIPDWLPLGAPANGNGDNFTPGFPSFNSGHAVFGSALFQVLRRFFREDKIKFSLKSDEYNGITVDSITKKPRPERIRYYESLSQAEQENEIARIYLGIHWHLDQIDGRFMGQAVANYICDELL